MLLNGAYEDENNYMLDMGADMMDWGENMWDFLLIGGIFLILVVIILIYFLNRKPLHISTPSQTTVAKTMSGVKKVNKIIEETSTFCPGCGTKLKKSGLEYCPQCGSIL